MQYSAAVAEGVGGLCPVVAGHCCARAVLQLEDGPTVTLGQRRGAVSPEQPPQPCPRHTPNQLARLQPFVATLIWDLH